MERLERLLRSLPDGVVRRMATAGDVESYVCYSPCEKYRYVLVRQWTDDLPRNAFCGLNPSTADERKNDPTVARCVAYARRWGYGGLIMLNLFSFRATLPRNLKVQHDPVGTQTDRFLKLYSDAAALTVACWGIHGAFQDRAALALPLFRRLHVLGLTRAGQPRHPLYLRSDLTAQPWRE